MHHKQKGRPLPEFAKTTGDTREYGEKLKALVAKQGISVEYDANIAPAQGVSSGGRIRLMRECNPRRSFSVLAHELAHEMLHHRKEAAPLPKVVRETQAEAVAFVVCRGVGLETNTAAADYIALYNGDKKTLSESLAVIQQTSSQILDELLPERRTTSFEKPQPDPTVPEIHSPAVAAGQSAPRSETAHSRELRAPLARVDRLGPLI